ncbi:MAG: RNA polymerase sigma factor RpoH [Pseudomonadota bacterium]|nr:RNA polymerase sigma factor RpoH [Pseudomonadota bacterium]
MNKALTAINNDLTLPDASGSLESYVHGVRSISILSKEEEQSLARQLRDHGDLEAARKLVLSQLRFVVHIARGYSGYGLPLSDLIQEGNIGLMKAVKRFDPDVGVRLVSFAVHWIRAEIHEFVIKNWRQVKVATTKAQRKLFFNLRKAKTHMGWLSQKETQAVAKDLGVKESEVVEMEQRLYSYDFAYDPNPSDSSEENYSPALYLNSPNSDPAKSAEEDELNQQASNALSTALKTLDARSKDILQSRWLGEKKTTLHELADRYKVSAERIRQIETNAIKKLREEIKPA